MQGPRSGREGGQRSGPEKLSSAPRSTSSIMWPKTVLATKFQMFDDNGQIRTGRNSCGL